MGLFKKSVVGLEIDSFEARAVELGGNVREQELLSFGRIDMPPGAVTDGIITNPKLTGQTLARLWSRCNFKSKKVMLGINNQDIIIRYAHVPKIPLDKLGNLIKFQAQDYLPIPLTNIELDYMVLGEKKADDGNELLKVMLVAAKRSMINGFISSMEEAKLIPLDIDVSGLSIMRLAASQDKHMPVVMVNLSTDTGSILLLNKGIPDLTRLILCGSGNTASIKPNSQQVASETSWMSAQSMQVSSVKTWDGDVLANEIKSSINYYNTFDNMSYANKIIFSGCGSRVKELAAILQEKTDMEITIPNPFQILSIPDKCNSPLDFEATDYTVSVSLALRGLE